MGTYITAEEVMELLDELINSGKEVTRDAVEEIISKLSVVDSRVIGDAVTFLYTGNVLPPSKSDRIVANDGDDKIFGGTENDTLSGNQGNDYISGDKGNDAIFGDQGNDLMEGGSGNDSFFFQPGYGTDSILRQRERKCYESSVAMM